MFVDKGPAWMIYKIKLLTAKNLVFKNFRKEKKNTDFFRKIKYLQERLNSLLSFSEENYYLKA